MVFAIARRIWPVVLLSFNLQGSRIEADSTDMAFNSLCQIATLGDAAAAAVNATDVLGSFILHRFHCVLLLPLGSPFSELFTAQRPVWLGITVGAPDSVAVGTEAGAELVGSLNADVLMTSGAVQKISDVTVGGLEQLQCRQLKKNCKTYY